MSDKIYVIGHKNPDLDSVAAAIAYSYLKNSLNKTDRYVACIPGEINKETEYALNKFGFVKPEILSNVSGMNIAMVDHNEFVQAAEGMAEAKIMEILDHHKVDFKYGEPIDIVTKPMGASCSIIAHMGMNHGVAFDKNLSGLMLSAILIDTVITKSPTCTEKDKEIIAKLAEIAEIADWQAFGMELFRVRSNVKELPTMEIIKSDFKDFAYKAGKFGIGQVETVDLAEFDEKIEDIKAELGKMKDEGGYHSVVLFITDIIKEGSLFFVSSSEQQAVEDVLGAKLENGQVYIPGILSRKKQVVPRFAENFDK